MKRFFFSLIALSAAAIGCTQSALLETPDFGGTEISFSPYTGRTPETKATSIETPAGLANANASAEAKADPNGFYVYGFLNQINGETKTTSVYLDNKKVYSPSKGQTANDWTYDGLVYWPTSEGSSLDFVAYSANGVGNFVDSEGNSTDSEGKPIQASSTGFTFKVPNTIDQQVDLLATPYQAGNTLSGGASVTLQFHHLLSRIGFKVQTTTDKKLIIKKLTFKGNMPNKGTLTFKPATGVTTPSLVPVQETNGYSQKTYLYFDGQTDPINFKNGKKIPGMESNYLMIMPHPVLEPDHIVELEYIICDSDGNQISDDKRASVKLPMGLNFLAGKAYEIVLKLSTSSISFDIQEEDWITDLNENEKEDDDIEVGPLQPDTDNEGIEDDTEEVNSITLKNDNVDLQFTLTKVDFTSAQVFVNITTQYRVSIFDGEGIGLAWRIQGNTNWNKSYHIDNSSGSSTTIYMEGLQSGQTYEICIYNYYSYYVGTKKDEWDNSDQILTFTTPTTFTLPECSAINLTEDDLGIDSQTRAPYAYIGGYFTEGYISSQKVPVSKYGLCWKAGIGTPTIINDNTSWTEYKSYNNFKIDNLQVNYEYSYCSYIIIAEDVYGLLVPEGKTSPVRTLLLAKNTIIYSPVSVFKTPAVVSNNDGTGGSWGTGSDVNINN